MKPDACRCLSSGEYKIKKKQICMQLQEKYESFGKCSNFAARASESKVKFKNTIIDSFIHQYNLQYIFKSSLFSSWLFREGHKLINVFTKVPNFVGLS